MKTMARPGGWRAFFSRCARELRGIALVHFHPAIFGPIRYAAYRANKKGERFFPYIFLTFAIPSELTLRVYIFIIFHLATDLLFTFAYAIIYIKT